MGVSDSQNTLAFSDFTKRRDGRKPIQRTMNNVQNCDLHRSMLGFFFPVTPVVVVRAGTQWVAFVRCQHFLPTFIILFL